MTILWGKRQKILDLDHIHMTHTDQQSHNNHFDTHHMLHLFTVPFTIFGYNGSDTANEFAERIILG